MGAVNRMLVDTAMVLSGAWLAVTAYSLSSPDAGLRHPGGGWVVLAVEIVAWAAALLLRVIPPWIFVAVAGVGVVALVLMTDPEAWSGASPVMAISAMMFTVCAAPILTERQAIGAILIGAALMISALTAVGVIFDVSNDLAWRAAPFSVAAAVAMGMAGVGIVRALRQVAIDSDEAAAEAGRALSVEAHDQALRAETERFAAVIHDGVINTLGAVARGSAERNRPLTIERCRVDATALRKLMSPSRDPRSAEGKASAGGRARPGEGIEPEDVADQVAAHARDRAHLLGLDLLVDARSTAARIPKPVLETVLSVVDEALLNISKHSGVGSARLTVECGFDWIRVEIGDDGRGFEVTSVGRPVRIADRCERTGIGLVVESSPRSGTSVRLGWRAGGSGDDVVAEPQPATTSLMEQARARMVRWVCGWLFSLFAVQTVVSWGLVPIPGNLLALAVVFVACVIGVRWAGVRDHLPLLATAYLVVAAGVATYGSAVGAVGCARIELGWWGPAGGCLVLILLILLSGLRWIIAGAVTYLLAGAGITWDLVTQAPSAATSACELSVVPSLFLDAVVVLVVIYLMQPLAIRHAATADRWRAEAAQAQLRAARRRAREEARQIHGERFAGPALSLLDSIADGSVDPGAPETRRACAREERYLRSLIVLDPDLDELGDVLADAVGFGRSRGIEVTIEAAEPVGLPGPMELHGIEVTVRAFLNHAQPGSAVNITLFPEDDGGRLTIMADRESLRPGFHLDAAGLSMGSLAVTDESDDDEYYIGLVWRTSKACRERVGVNPAI